MGFFKERTYKTASASEMYLSFIMLKAIILLAAYTGLTLGGPQPRRIMPTMGGRIVGGKEADIADYPWTVSIQERNVHACGGAIISSTWILSAAHCVIARTISDFTIRAGSSSRTIGGQVITLSRIIIHAQYDSNLLDYDITAIELSIAIAVRSATPIPIVPAGKDPVAGATVTVTGWGALSDAGEFPVFLHVVEVPVVSQIDCQLAYGSIVTERMFCAGEVAGGRDACASDSGGPAIIDGAVAGIVSWGSGCGLPEYPGVYTSLSTFRSWITDNTGI